MATRQYIGPRFVIKIYKNSLDPNSAEWENVAFEPLTMVTFQNSSYISRSQVPANVGNPVTATTYWACTGYYNGQIASLQSNVANLNSIAETLTNHYKNPTVTPSEILLITDSFGENPNGNVITGFNLCIGGTCESIAQGGANYATFASMINGYSGNKSAIKAIIICGGTNERIVADINTHMEAIKTATDTFPNAIVYFAFTYSNFANSSYRALENSILKETINGCAEYGFIFLGNFNKNLYPTYLNIQNDGTHPIPSTGNKLGSAIFNAYSNNNSSALLCSTFDVTDSNYGITFRFVETPDNLIHIRISGTTTTAIPAGTFIEIPLDNYYYTDSLPTGIISEPLMIKGLGYILIALNNNVLKYYFVALPGGSTTIPSGTYIDPISATIVEYGAKLYKITNS